VITVLYVDDEPGLLEIGKIFLEQNGQFSVDTITSAPAALALMETKAYDAIISDYQMPDMDGIRFLKKVRSSGNTIPFILFTGRGREEIVIQALNEGADYYLQKGGDLLVQFTELTHQIRQAVQQRRAETSLRDHERREADIINFLPDATFAIDTKGTVIAWNHAMEEMTGVKPAEILGKNNYEYAVPFYHERRPILIDLVLAPDEKFEKENYLYTIRDHTMLTAETLLEKPDGSQVHLWEKACSLFDKNGNLAGAIESVRDITRNRQADEALRESEERYRTLFETAADGIIVHDAQGRNIDANARACEMLGYSHDEFLAMRVPDLIPEEELQQNPPRLADVLAGRPVCYERKLRRKDGTLLDIEIRGSRVTEGRVQAFWRDITDRKQAEKALHESEDMYRTIFTTTGAATIIIEKDTTIVLANEGFAQLSGYSIGELEGKRSWTEFVVPEDLERIKTYHRNRSTDPDSPPGVYEFRFIDRDGRVKYCINNVAVIPGTTRSVASVLDITDRVLAEQDYRSIVENIQDVFYRTDSAGNLIRVSPSGAEIMGYDSVSDMYGKSIAETLYVNPEDRSQFLAELEKGGGQVINYEVQLKKKDGTPVYALVSSHKYYDAAGNFGGIEGILRDITGRKQAEDALRESEARYRLLADTSPEFIYLVNPEGCIQYVNSSAARGFKTTPEELVGKHVSDLFPPDIALQHLEAIHKVISTRQPSTHEIADVLPSGKIWIEVRLSPVFDREDRVIGVLGLSNDITQRKCTEDALRESEVRFRTIFENQQNGLMMVDAETHVIVDANRIALSLIGATRDDVIGRVCHTFICPAEEGKCPVTDLGFTVDMSERVLLNIRGERIPVIKSVSKATLGNNTYLIESFTDITDRKRTEEALRASEEKYRGIFENTSVAVFQTRINGSITTANPAFARLLRYETPEMAIREVPNIRAIYVDPVQRDKLYQLLVTRGAVEDFELALTRSDGSTLFASVNVWAVYGDDGKITGLEGLAVDITDRKKTEEALREVNKKLNLLARITRHDMNNQLLLLRAYLELLKQKLLDPSLNAYFQKVVNAAQSISSMIRFMSEYEEVGIDTPVWQDCHALLDTAAKDVPLGTVVIKNDLPSGAEVFADPLIVKVFYNLMDNAIRHGRKITAIRFSLQESGEGHLILCEDDGDGVPADEKERIFDRDFGRNTGLGLFLSREVLAITRITIRENGEPGKGARFEILVPEGAFRFSAMKQE
jgi:PAS domain S-box-containing protein